MEHSVVVTRKIHASPDEVWAAVRGIDGLDRWFPVIASCKVEGNGVGAMRFMDLAGGGELHDRIVEIDDSARLLRYLRVVHPFPVTRYLGTVEVSDTAQSVEVRWTIDLEVEPADCEATAQFLFSAISEGVAGMARELEAG